MKSSVRFVTRTAILLALTVLFQSLRRIMPIPQTVDQFIIGSLVNLCLVVAAVVVGVKGGVIVAILAPLVAFFQGVFKFPILVPFIALGNTVIVACVAALYRKNKYLSIMSGAVLKFLTLYVTVVHIALPMIVPQLEGKSASVIPKMLSFKFSWPQLVTALIGGTLALIILPLLKKSFAGENRKEV